MKKNFEFILKDALDAMGEAIAVWDEKDTLIYFNDRYKEFFELSDRVKLGVKFSDLVKAHIDSDDVNSLDGISVKNEPELYSKLRMDYHRKCEGVFIDQSSKNTWRQIKERKFNGNMTVGIYTDITEQKNVEQLLNKAKNELEIANQVKASFLANITHELKTPLHAILSYAQLIKNSTKNLNYNTSAIISSAQYLTSMIDDMIETTKLDMKDNKIEKKDIKIPQLIDDISKMFTVIAKNKNIDFSVLEENLPLVIQSDERKIKQILINLIGNAIKFTSKGNVTLKIKAIKKGIKFIVEDTGIGISKKDFEKIFIPFEKLENKFNSQGTGLGLAISNEYAKFIHSAIQIKSKIKKGSSFSFIVPYDSKKSNKTLNQKINIAKKVNKQDLDLSHITKQQLEDSKVAIQRLYYSKLEEVFNSFDESIKSHLLQLLRAYEWEKLEKIFNK